MTETNDRARHRIRLELRERNTAVKLVAPDATRELDATKEAATQAERGKIERRSRICPKT